MQKVAIAGAALVLLAGAADAQQRVVMHGPGTSYAPPAPQPEPAAYPPAPPVQPGHSRWGSKVNGRWWGGANAPGGWAAYRRPYRGYVVPGYWNNARFRVDDYATYGLSRPPFGYSWARYYDDAVLIDGRGSVYDAVPGIDWDGYGYADDDRVYADAGPQGRPAPYPPVAPGYGAGATYPVPAGDDRYDRERRDRNGVTGAVVGAAAGGLAGNLIAGHGDRLGGTLIGAGLGGLAGYAVGSSADGHHRYDHRVPEAPDYPPPPPYAPPPVVAYAQPGWRSPDGLTTVTTTSSPFGGSTTTVVVRSAPVVTTTTEVFEDDVTYTRPCVLRHRVWHRPACRCR